MQDFQMRVIEEYAELKGRRENLRRFIFNVGGPFEQLPEEDRKLLRLQFEAMGDYETALQNRIARF